MVSGAISLWVIAKLRREDNGYELPPGTISKDGEFKVKLSHAIVPLIPIAILVSGSMGLVPAFKPIAISHAMIIGCFCAFLVSRKNPQQLSKEFWKGAGDAFGHVFGIIICALVFVGGLSTVGLIQQFIQMMIENPSIAKVSSSVGPFIIGIMSGSGDAASVAFNKAVTIHAATFGLDGASMGSVVAISGALGRTMSPVAGGMIICATLAGVSPVETAKRNAPGMIIATVVLTFLMFF